MKVLFVNCVYEKGSTGKIVRDLQKGLEELGIATVVCYGRGKNVSKENVYKTCGELESYASHFFSKLNGLRYGGNPISTKRLEWIIEKEKPDIVHLHCLNGYFLNIYRFIVWLKRHDIKTVLTLHAEFMYTGNCGIAYDCDRWRTGCGSCPRLKQKTGISFLDRTSESWKRMKSAFEGFGKLKVVAVSDWIRQRAGQSPVLNRADISCIHNGIDIQNFTSIGKQNEREYLEQKYGIPGNKRIILHVTPGFDNSVKGGDFFIKIAERLPQEYQAVIVGCNEKVSDAVISIAFTNNQADLAAVYRAADVFAMTSRMDNYPTVCVEANCCGTPIVGFDVGGVAETIGTGMGEVVPAFDLDAFYKKVIFWSEKKHEISTHTISERRKYCDRSRMTEDYLNLYRQFECQ